MRQFDLYTANAFELAIGFRNGSHGRFKRGARFRGFKNLYNSRWTTIAITRTRRGPFLCPFSVPLALLRRLEVDLLVVDVARIARLHQSLLEI